MPQSGDALLHDGAIRSSLETCNNGLHLMCFSMVNPSSAFSISVSHILMMSVVTPPPFPLPLSHLHYSALALCTRSLQTTIIVTVFQRPP